MSADPQMMAQLLMRNGQQQPGMGGTNQSSGGTNLLQQILAMQQLKQRLGQPPQQPPQAGMPPGAPMPQTLNSSMAPGING